MTAATYEPIRSIFEREARFTAPPGLALPRFHALATEPLLAGLAIGTEFERRRDSRYYDTPELTLADAGITVRRDHLGDGYDWRLVITDDATAAYPIRRQLHYPGGAGHVPEPLLAFLASHHRRRGLVPIASVAGLAHVVPFQLPGAVRLGDIVDEHIHVRTARGCGTSRQISVTTPILNRVGEAFLSAVTAELLEIGCRLELPTGDPFRFTGAVADADEPAGVR